jgi:hypothetical protein
VKEDINKKRSAALFILSASQVVIIYPESQTSG